MHRAFHYRVRPHPDAQFTLLSRSNGLLLKLAAFFLACGIPALFAVDAARTVVKFAKIKSVRDSAAMRDEVAREGRAVKRHRH